MATDEAQDLRVQAGRHYDEAYLSAYAVELAAEWTARPGRSQRGLAALLSDRGKKVSTTALSMALSPEKYPDRGFPIRLRVIDALGGYAFRPRYFAEKSAGTDGTG